VYIVQFPVGEQTGPPDTAENIAGLAALTSVVVIHGTLAPMGDFALVDNQDPQVRMLAKMKSGE
jgi:hypothetical protein